MLGRNAFTHFAARKFSVQVTYLMLATFVFLCLATPFNLVHGFLFAEEGTTYFRYARLAYPMQALLAPHQQYFALFPNALALLVGRVLPISWAAITSAWLVLLAHLWMIYMVTLCERFDGARTRLVAVAAMLLAPGAAAVTVGSTQTQFVFAVVCIIVFISDPEQHRISRTLSVVLGGLNGVVSCMLTPFFLYRAWRTRSHTAWLQAVLLCMCCAVQAAVLIHTLPFGSRGAIPHRSLAAYVNVLASHMVVLPYLTRFVYHPVTQLYSLSANRVPIVTCLSLAGIACVVYVIWPAGSLARVLLLMGIFHGTCCAIGIEGTYRDFLGSGERYFVVGNAAIVLGLLLRWQQVRSAPMCAQRYVTYALLALMLLSGLIDYARFWKLNQSGDVWASEVREWRKDPLHATLTANPDGWNGNRMYVTQKPTRLDLPSYIFDSNTPASVRATLPQKWFGPTPAGMDQGR